jgi:hypothetical protein
LSLYRAVFGAYHTGHRPHSAVQPSATVTSVSRIFLGDWMTSDMVTAGETLRPPPALSAAHTPFLATSQLSPEQAFTIPKWRPRNGLDEHHPLWKAGIRRLLAAYDLSETELVEGVTQCRNLLSGATPVIFPQDTDEALAQAAQLDTYIEQWKSINTAVFWHVLSSVDMVSSYSLTDMPSSRSSQSGKRDTTCHRHRTHTTDLGRRHRR